MSDTHIPAQTRAQFDAVIHERAERSTRAPADFVASELRRKYARRYNPRFDTWLLDADNCSAMADNIENEYVCYFRPEEYEPFFGDGWKSVYAGCNAQIESFLDENGFEDVFRELGFRSTRRYQYRIDEYVPTPHVKNSRLPDVLRLYLTGIGYLYPDGDRSIIHPNLFQAHTGSGFGDTYFLTRDLIRAPYHAVNDERKLTGEMMWNYWRTLVTLAHSDIPEYKYPRIDDAPELYGEYRAQGALFVPQRYLELKPVVETFDWLQD